MNKYIFSLMLLSGLVAAQETKNVGEVVIQGKFLNTPYQKIVENIEVITKKDIENAPAQSIADLYNNSQGWTSVEEEQMVRRPTFPYAGELMNRFFC